MNLDRDAPSFDRNKNIVCHLVFVLFVSFVIFAKKPAHRSFSRNTAIHVVVQQWWAPSNRHTRQIAQDFDLFFFYKFEKR